MDAETLKMAAAINIAEYIFGAMLAGAWIGKMVQKDKKDSNPEWGAALGGLLIVTIDLLSKRL